MKVLLINGSPNEKGCTYTALSEVAKSLNKNGIDTEILHVGGDTVPGCLDCSVCDSTGMCVYDDIVNATAARLSEFDAFVFGSPVYYAGPSGQLTSFLDRLYSTAGSKLRGKPGAAVVSCRRAGSTAALDRLNKYFTINCMPLVTSQYWNMVHGNTPDEVRRDAEGMQIMRTLGENMAWLMKCIEAGRSAGVPEPEYEPRVNTNFIR